MKLTRVIDMTIDEIKKAIREIEISYDYNHSKNDYDIVLNLTELANLMKTLQGRAIDDFADTLKENYDYLPQIFSKEEFVRYIDEYAEQLKASGTNGL